MIIFIRIFFASILLCIVSSACAQKIVHLTSLEWPPYSGENLKGQGASIAVARAAFSAMGYELKVDFFPWARTVALAKKEDSKYSGYFPEYFSDDIAKRFLFSDVMGVSPLGFAEHRTKPIPWETLDDLPQYRMGVVRGYINTDELDERIARGQIKTEAVVADVDNIKKLSARRLDLAVIDQHVFHYLLTHESQLKGAEDKVSFNKTLLANKALFMCFKKSKRGRELRDIYNEGLKKIDAKAILDEYLIQ